MRRALALLALPLTLAACGSSSGSLRDAARFAPPNATTFAAVDTGDEHWRGFVRQLLGSVPPVPRDAHTVAFAVVDGQVHVVSRELKRSLADTRAYRDAVDTVPRGAHAIAFSTGADVRRRLLAFPGLVGYTGRGARYRTIRRPHSGPSLVAELRYRWGVAWQTDKDGGARAQSAGLPVAVSRFPRAVQQLATPYRPSLFDEIPGDALAVLDFPLGQGAFESLPGVPQLVRSIFHGSRYDLPLELDALLQGETALYLRRGGEITLVSQPQDTAAAELALEQLLAARRPPWNELHVDHDTIGGQLVVSTSRRGIATFRGGGDKLSSRLDLPEQVSAVAYVAPGAEQALAAFGIRDARPLTAWLLADGADPTVTVRFGGTSG
jgi:hypothetical protein